MPSDDIFNDLFSQNILFNTEPAIDTDGFFTVVYSDKIAAMRSAVETNIAPDTWSDILHSAHITRGTDCARIEKNKIEETTLMILKTVKQSNGTLFLRLCDGTGIVDATMSPKALNILTAEWCEKHSAGTGDINTLVDGTTGKDLFIERELKPPTLLQLKNVSAVLFNDKRHLVITENVVSALFVFR
ncbi:MAG: uncharacterized protein A8A55_1545 [Amphiamblys sp. WSBS2006]|nr:MAG: uncharacterized protein A8A55_1545 [Amphiamblys sp. WSBS2006]